MGEMSGEKLNTEYKQEYVSDIKKEVIAFANAEGGTVFVGICNDGAVKGVDDPDEVMLRIVNSLKDAIAPDVMPFVRVDSVAIEGRNVIEIQITTGTNRPYYLREKGLKPGGVYVRKGSSSQPQIEMEIRKMEMTMRWFGKDYDTVTLEQIKQTRYATGIITTLYNKMPGEVWNLDEILAMKKEVEDAGLHLAGIESVNVSDAIKTGGAGRDHDIQAYIETLENLGKADIHMVCYNFMPVFDWTRTELDRVREDGSTVMAYNQDAIDKMDPEKMFDAIKDDMNGTVMPGWEPERMAKIKDLFALYKGIDEDQLFEDLKYFLEADRKSVV